MATLKQSTKDILVFLQNHTDEDLTANDVADALGISAKSVNGSFLSFVTKKWGYREETEIELADGKHQTIKLLRLTDTGRSIDPENPPAPEGK